MTKPEYQNPVLYYLGSRRKPERWQPVSVIAAELGLKIVEANAAVDSMRLRGLVETRLREEFETRLTIRGHMLYKMQKGAEYD